MRHPRDRIRAHLGDHLQVRSRQSVLLVAIALLASACASVGSPTTTADPGSSTSPGSPSPRRTVVRDSRVVAAGRVVPFQAQRGVRLRLRASAPSTSTSSLSAGYGYPPSHGYYVTFRLSLANTGRKPVQVGPDMFVVVVRGQGRVTSYDGNAPYSGAPKQLDTTELDPGDVIGAPLSFDVRRTHGRLLFVPDRSAAVVWTF